MRPVLTVLPGAMLALVLPLTASTQSANPFEGDENAINAGAALYASRCPECHGADAKGLSGPDLTRLWTAGASDARVFTTIQQGVPNSTMPPSGATDTEIWALVAYLRSISTVPPFDHPPGDAARGREVFAAKCSRCHRAGGIGATLGPDLSRIAESRSLEALVQAIRDPSAAIAPGYRVATLVTRDRERIVGLVKAEDAFSIQVLDLEQRLRGFRKAALREILRAEGSLMSVLGAFELSQREFDDVLAYLATLRADAERT